jgi:hypothetical protein
MEELDLDESPVRAILKLCFALTYPGSEGLVVEDAIDELLRHLQNPL